MGQGQRGHSRESTRDDQGRRGRGETPRMLLWLHLGRGEALG